MSVNLSFIGGAGWQFFNDNGVPLAGGKIYTYAAGTTTPLATYTSRTGLTPNTNPIILDAAGRTPEQVWATEGLLYKYVVTTSADVLIRTWDNIGGTVVASDLAADLASTSDNAKGDALVGFKQANASGFLTGAIARTVNTKLQETVSVKDFGATGDGVTDDTAAIQAAINYAQSRGTLYGGGAIKVKIPSGVYFLNSVSPTNSDAIIDITNATNVLIEGDGDGCTTILGNLDKSIFRADRTAASPLFRFGMRDLTIEGLGSTYTDNHAIWLSGGNNCYFEDVRIWKARTGIRYQTCFHTEFINLRMNGQGGLALYDGLYAADGEVAVAENAVGVYGGRIQGCIRYGWRGECITGSSVFGLEILGCGVAGLYFGESPNGKDLKWFTWVGGLVDTCPDLIIVKKGTSTVAELIQFSGMWLGYATDTLIGAGTSVEFIGLKDSCFAADIIANTMYAANIENCERISFSVGTIWVYDRLDSNAVAIICNNTSKSRFDVGTTKKLDGSSSTTAFIEQGTSDYNLITGTFDGAVTTIGANSNKTLVVLT